MGSLKSTSSAAPPFDAFVKMSPKRQHRIAAILLRKAYSEKEYLSSYNAIAAHLSLPPLDHEQEALSHRYHLHLQLASLQLKEHNLLPNVRHLDRLDSAPFLPIDIYLDQLRSAHNVGSIIRTTEAFRLGTIHFAGVTPTNNNEKVQATSMGCVPLVPCRQNTPLESLRRPLIALETTEEATPLHTFAFPPSFTLLLGNEEFGLSKSLLEAADIVLEIPLQGSKNSLNVAAAFAIAAATIRSSYAH
jgi:tRNA G18 (ribose-2'-O)-methylase SpoU